MLRTGRRGSPRLHASSSRRNRGVHGQAGRPVARCSGGGEAAAAQEGLRKAGVKAANDGTVGLEHRAAMEYVASAWQKDQPITELGQLKMESRVQAPQGAPQAAPARLPRRLVSRIYKHLDAVEAAALWHGASSEAGEVMLSSGGAGAGGLWIAMPFRMSDFCDTAHFRCASLLRLAALRPPADRDVPDAQAGCAGRWWRA